MNQLTFDKVPNKIKALAIVVLALLIVVINNPGIAQAAGGLPKP